MTQNCTDEHCLGCRKCEDGPMVTLVCGHIVCNECAAWRMECEAREIVKGCFPHSPARVEERLKKIHEERGENATVKLRLVARKVWSHMIREGEK